MRRLQHAGNEFDDKNAIFKLRTTPSMRYPRETQGRLLEGSEQLPISLRTMVNDSVTFSHNYLLHVPVGLR